MPPVATDRSRPPGRPLTVRELYTVPDYDLAGQFIDELIRDMADKT